MCLEQEKQHLPTRWRGEGPARSRGEGGLSGPYAGRRSQLGSKVIMAEQDLFKMQRENGLCSYNHIYQSKTVIFAEKFNQLISLNAVWLELGFI